VIAAYCSHTSSKTCAVLQPSSRMWCEVQTSSTVSATAGEIVIRISGALDRSKPSARSAAATPA
jgi:hypothetical protein